MAITDEQRCPAGVACITHASVSNNQNISVIFQCLHGENTAVENYTGNKPVVVVERKTSDIFSFI